VTERTHSPTPTKKRKKSPSPTRKKARVESAEPTVRADDKPPPTHHTQPATTTTLSREEQSELDRFFSEIDSLTQSTLPPLSTPTPTVTPTVTPTLTPQVTRPKPVNPFAGRIEFLRPNFGTDYHDAAHFKPTDLKSKHGVWNDKLKQVKEWVGEAINHVYYDDTSIVASKAGSGASKGGRNYLIDMGKPVGYLSGSSVPSGTHPEARYIALYVNKKGVTVSAFPCTPEMF
jgi:hypothetical protein